MQLEWRKLQPEGNRETYALWVETGTFKKSLAYAKLFTKVAEEHDIEANISYSSESITIMINPFGDNKLSKKEYDAASAISDLLAAGDHLDL